MGSLSLPWFQITVHIHNRGRNIGYVVASTTVSHRNCAVILNHTYNRILTVSGFALDDFGHVCIDILTKN
jgi:hypothetical protein